jgi:hypothetical protein
VVGDVEGVRLEDEGHLPEEWDAAAQTRIDIPLRGIAQSQRACTRRIADQVQQRHVRVLVDIYRLLEGIDVEVLNLVEVRCGATARTVAEVAVLARLPGREAGREIRHALTLQRGGASAVCDLNGRAGVVGIDAGELPSADQSANEAVAAPQAVTAAEREIPYAKAWITLGVETAVSLRSMRFCLKDAADPEIEPGGRAKPVRYGPSSPTFRAHV